MESKRVSRKNSYFVHNLETMTRSEIQKLQLEKTKQTLELAYNESPFYRRLFKKAKVKPGQLKSLQDIARFPFIEKKDLVKDQEQNPPLGQRVCLPADQIRRINITSGTSGMGQEVHCHDDGAIWAANTSTAIHFAAIGLNEGDVSGLLYPLGTMTGGMLSYEALRNYGAVPLPLAVFSSEQKIDTMRRFKVQHMLTTPAYLTRITSLLMEKGLEPGKEFPLLKGITLSTEPFSVDWALRMEEIWGCTLHDIYGSTQLNLNYAITCKYGVVPDGKYGHYHLTDYLALVEVLDRKSGLPVKPGEWGEPVVTTFSRRAMPLIRFRSNDRVRVLPPRQCECGRDASITWEVGTIARYDDMIKIKASNVWPQMVDDVVFTFAEVDEYNGHVFISEQGKEVAQVSLEFKRMNLEQKTKEAILQKIKQRIKEITQVTMGVVEVPPGTLPRYEYKVRRWNDERIQGLSRVKFTIKD